MNHLTLPLGKGKGLKTTLAPLFANASLQIKFVVGLAGSLEMSSSPKNLHSLGGVGGALRGGEYSIGGVGIKM